MAAAPRLSGAPVGFPFGMIDKVADQRPPDPVSPGGVAFTVPELMMLAAWAEYHAIRMVIELDNCIDGIEYDEVAALYPSGSRLRQWTLWRSPDAIVAEPMNGGSVRADCITDLLHHLAMA